LTFDNVPVKHVGVILEILKDAGFELEINLALPNKP
jgi:hypothetical protein